MKGALKGVVGKVPQCLKVVCLVKWRKVRLLGRDCCIYYSEILIGWGNGNKKVVFTPNEL